MSEERVVLITGTSSGFGRATATLLARSGCRVFGTSRHPEEVQGMAGVTLLPLDVRDPESLAACVQAVIVDAGRLDVLVNNAGYAGPEAAGEEMGEAQLRAVFETNFFGLVQMTKAVLPAMREQGGGYVINVSSIVGRVGVPFFAAYVASKHAVEGYTESLRHEVSPFNIHVVLVEPGFFKTNIYASMEDPAHPLETYAPRRRVFKRYDHYCLAHGRDPRLVAQAVLRIIEDPAPRLRYPVGLDAHVITALKHWLPFSWFARGLEWLMLKDCADEDFGRDVRHYFTDSETADALASFVAGGALVALLWGVQHLLRSRR